MATFTVTNTNNSGAGSLRQAVLDANALSGKDIINFGGLFTDGLAHTISLTASGLSITDDLIIQGTNPNLLTIKDNSATRVFDIASGVTAAINGLTVTNSYKGTGGGGISNVGTLTLNNSIITGNSVYNNALYSNGTDTFSAGGGIDNTGSLTLNYSTISDNTALSSRSRTYGGGIYNTGSLTLNYSTITGNTANDPNDPNAFLISYNYSLGGGIYTGNFYGKSDTIVNNSTITDNTGFRGGGICVESGSILVNNSTITDNTAFRVKASSDPSSNLESAGGGIFSSTSSPVSINNSIISRNSADNGGGIELVGANPSVNMSVNNSTISYNRALYSGGGVGGNDFIDPGFQGRYPYYGDYTITVSNSTISNNYAELGAGGGISNTGTLIVKNSIISDNQAASGGGIFNASLVNDDTLSVSNTTISNNRASQEGGGIDNGEGGTMTLNSIIVAGNTAGTDGGGIFNEGYSVLGGELTGNLDTTKNPTMLTLQNSIISGNQAARGGGIFNDATLWVSNSTISNNHASNYGGGIYTSVPNHYVFYSGEYTSNIGAIVSNSTISDNQAHFGGGIYNSGTLTVGNSIINHNRAFGIELSPGQQESGKGGGIYNSDSSYATATIDYSSIACNFDTPEEDSNKFIKIDNLVGKFITKGSVVRA